MSLWVTLLLNQMGFNMIRTKLNQIFGFLKYTPSSKESLPYELFAIGATLLIYAFAFALSMGLKDAAIIIFALSTLYGTSFVIFDWYRSCKHEAWLAKRIRTGDYRNENFHNHGPCRPSVCFRCSTQNNYSVFG